VGVYFLNTVYHCLIRIKGIGSGWAAPSVRTTASTAAALPLLSKVWQNKQGFTVPCFGKIFRQMSVIYPY